MIIINDENTITDHLDVENAFLNGNLKEEIYTNPPSSYKHKNSQVWRLKKSLYGFKREECYCDNCLSKIGLKKLEADEIY